MKIKTINGKIFPTNPFDFSKSLNFINMFAPTGGEQSINDLSFTKAVYMEDQTLAFRIEDEGTVEKPILNYTIFANKNISESVKT